MQCVYSIPSSILYKRLNVDEDMITELILYRQHSHSITPPIMAVIKVPNYTTYEQPKVLKIVYQLWTQNAVEMRLEPAQVVRSGAGNSS